MKKKLTAICCAALLAPALYAPRPEPAALIAQEARGNANAAYRLYELAQSGQLHTRKADNDRDAQRYLSRAAELELKQKWYRELFCRVVSFFYFWDRK